MHLSTDAPDKLLTDAAIVAMLEERCRAFRNRIKFWRASGMKISYSHLANIMLNKRPPNDAVLKFLGVNRVQGYRGVKSK